MVAANAVVVVVVVVAASAVVAADAVLVASAVVAADAVLVAVGTAVRTWLEFQPDAHVEELLVELAVLVLPHTAAVPPMKRSQLLVPIPVDVELLVLEA